MRHYLFTYIGLEFTNLVLEFTYIGLEFTCISSVPVSSGAESVDGPFPELVEWV